MGGADKLNCLVLLCFYQTIMWFWMTPEGNRNWFACFCVHCVFLCFLTPSVGVLSVAPGLLKACLYNSFLSSKASSFDHTWFPSGCNEPQHLASTRKLHNQRGPMASWSTKCKCLRKGNWKYKCFSTWPCNFHFHFHEFWFSQGRCI